MVRLSVLLSLLVVMVATFSTTAFAPTPTFFQTVVPSTTFLSVKVRVKIDVGDGEPIEGALRRFKREVNQSGHLMELRHKRYFENSQEKKKRKIREGQMRKKFERMNKRRMANRT